MARIRNPFFGTPRPSDCRRGSRARNPRYAPEFLEGRLSPSTFTSLTTTTAVYGPVTPTPPPPPPPTGGTYPPGGTLPSPPPGPALPG